MGCYGALKVPRGDAGEDLELELQRLRCGYGYGPVLERERGIDTVILDVQVVQSEFLAQVIGLQQRGESCA